MKEIPFFESTLIILALAVTSHAQKKSAKDNPPVTVTQVDLNRYVGSWYEIAKIPNFFQKKCYRNTTATYTLKKDGTIEVVNRCVEESGKEDVAKGIAEVVDTITNAKLKVSFVSIFGIHLFWGDYWIIGLDKDYRYAVVGDPLRKYGWILSRTSTISAGERAEVDEVLRKQGYDPKDFLPTVQTATDSPASKER